MLTVYKYSVPVVDYFTLAMPPGARLLTVQVQRQQPQMWALVDANTSSTEDRHFRLAGTGHPIQEKVDSLVWVGTFQINQGSLIFHVFEILGGSC